MNKSKQIFRYLRWLILMCILIFVTYGSYLHQVLGGEKAPSIHALCPFGGLESLYSILFSGAFIQKIFTATIVILVLTILISTIFRRSFCGLLCPFGALQEFFAKTGQKILGKRYLLPTKIDKPLRYLKYLILFITIIAAWITKGLWMSPYDPYAAYGHISEGFVGLYTEFLIGTILLIITVIGSFFYDRFFCKYLCPVGAFYGIISKLSPTKIVRTDSNCVHCKICSKNCPVNIDVEKLNTVTSIECIGCNECVNTCPRKDALTIQLSNKKISPIIVIALVISIFFGSIFIAEKSGLYQSTPAPLKQGEVLKPEQIRGYMTLEDIAKGLGINKKELYQNLNIPDNIPSTTKLKELSSHVEGFSPEKVKELLENK